MATRQETTFQEPPWLETYELLRQRPAGIAGTGELAEKLGFRDRSELDRQTLQHFHCPAKELLLSWQLAEACRLLIEGSDSEESIAADLGIGEPPEFDEIFRRHLLLSPKDFRALRTRERWHIELPAWWRQQSVVEYWGRDPSSRHEQASAAGIRWALTSPHGPVGLKLRLPALGSGQRSAEVRLSSGGPRLAPWVHLTLIRLLGLHLRPDNFERRTLEGPHGSLVANRRGLVIPQTANLFDGIAWVVCGQQVSLPVAFKLRRGLAERFGRPMGDLLTTPDVTDIASSEQGELFALGFSRRKEEYLQGIARQISAEPGLDVEGLRYRSAREIESRLLAVRGLGPWSVNYLMMRSYGLEDCVPVGDAALVRALQGFFGLERRPNADQTRELMTVFAPHRSLASFHFWASLKDGSG